MLFGGHHIHAVENLPSMMLVLNRAFPGRPDMNEITTLFSFVYYAYAGFYRPPTEDHVDSGGADMSWPAEEGVTALANEGYIPSPLADAGDTGPTLNGIDFWDDAGEPQRPTLRARMQSDSISFTRQTQRAGVSSTLFATPEPLIPGSRP